jgi:hypothetical protein
MEVEQTRLVSPPPYSIQHILIVLSYAHLRVFGLEFSGNQERTAIEGSVCTDLQPNHRSYFAYQSGQGQPLHVIYRKAPREWGGTNDIWLPLSAYLSRRNIAPLFNIETPSRLQPLSFLFFKNTRKCHLSQAQNSHSPAAVSAMPSATPSQSPHSLSAP